MQRWIFARLLLNPPVRCETLSSGVASWLDGYRSMIWGMRYILSPVILVTMALVLGNAISIGVRERRTDAGELRFPARASLREGAGGRRALRKHCPNAGDLRIHVWH